MKILVINPGSTSTKIAVYENETPLFVSNIKHSVEELSAFPEVIDQFEFRKNLVLQELENNKIPFSFDAIIGRGGLVKPIAVRMVYQVAQAVKVPIIGMGGIASAEDALEFILAGATAVSIGTANFFNPYATVETVRGIEEYMRRHKVDDNNSLIGAVR